MKPAREVVQDLLTKVKDGTLSVDQGTVGVFATLDQVWLAHEHRMIIQARQDELFEAYSAHNNEEEDYWSEREDELNALLDEADGIKST